MYRSSSRNTGWMLVLFVAAGVVSLLIAFKTSNQEAVESPQDVVVQTPQNEVIPTAGPVDETEVDFIQTGVLNLETEEGNLGREEWVLVYEKPGAPALVASLIFSGESMCEIAAVLQPCSEIVLSDGVTVTVFGNEVDTRVRVLRLESEGSSPSGEVVPWSEARAMLLRCEVVQVIQTHDLAVRLQLANGRNVTTVEPEIDVVFGVIEEANQTCQTPPMVATE